MYHLEDNLKNATNSTDIQGVYWSARDLDSSPVGNHHFFTFVYQDKAQAERIKSKYGLDYFSEENDKKFVVYFATVGLSRDNDNKITIYTNDNSDKKSIHEIAKDDNTSFWKPDFDYEGHKVPPGPNNKYASSELLMSDILDRKSIYMAYYAENTKDYPRVSYSLVNENCASLVNTILDQLGFPKGTREDLGEFSGVDWGEEDVLASMYFRKPMSQFVPTGSYTNSSRNITVQLLTNSQKSNKTWQPSALDLTYLNNAKVANMDGVLKYDGVQNPPLSGYVPGGSYKDSSNSVKVILSATCQKTNGSWQESVIDITNSLNAKVENKDGVLTFV